MMLAAIYHEFGGPIRVERVHKPEVPSDDGIILQVLATGVCRSDWHGWQGHDGDVLAHGLPFCPGHEVSGVIVRVGEQVTRLNIGDRVAVPFILSCGSCRSCTQLDRPTVCEDQRQPGFTQWGSFAEYLAIPRAERNVCRIQSKKVSFVQAAALGCRFTTAYRAVVSQGGVSERSPSIMAVFGCGGLGLSCIMIARATSPNIKIVAIDRSEAALNKAKELGADNTINSMELSVEGVRDQVHKVSDGVDLAIESAGVPATVEASIACLRPAGRMVQVGLPIGGKSPNVPMGLVTGKELEIVGSHGFDGSKDLPVLLEMVANGKLDPSKLVDREVSLEEGCRVLMDMNRTSPIGMVMITKFLESSDSTDSRLAGFAAH